MDVSPFPYQGPLDPTLVRGRDDLIADLVERVSEHRLTALLGPRRFGKTSVLRRVAADVAAAGTVVVWVDLYEVSSMADLAARFDMALAPLGAVDERIGRLAAGVELNLGLVRVELRKPASSRPDPLLTVHAQLEVVTKLAAQMPVLLVFDEFAGINRVHGAAGLLRTHLQPHYTRLGIVFAGSEPSMMRALFFLTSSSRSTPRPTSSRSARSLVPTSWRSCRMGSRRPVGTPAPSASASPS